MKPQVTNRTAWAAVAVTLATLAALALAPLTGAGTGAATCSISDASVTEGNSGTAALAFSVQCNAPASLDYQTADGTAAAPDDYTPASGALDLDIRSGLQQTIVVEVNGDTEAEDDETIAVSLSTADPTVTLSPDTATGTILNDDAGTGPCILLSDTVASVSGTVSTSSNRSVIGAEPLTLTNCGSADVNLQARGTDASGPGALWQLVDAGTDSSVNSVCELGLNVFRASVGLPGSQGGGVGIGLTTADRALPDPEDTSGLAPFVLAAAASHDFFIQVEMPCAGSDGLGQAMSMDVTLTAVAP